MRIAIIGSGIAGLVCAWRLSPDHAVTLYEAGDRLGGHTHTHDIALDGKHYAVDSGFIVHNPAHYPHFTALLDELGVASQPSTMSFSVHRERGALEYNTTSPGTLFCQRRNLFSPRFLGMLNDLRRFYRTAPSLLRGASPGPSLGEYLDTARYGAAFRDDHLIPMASALWSSPARQILDFPARYLVQFMANHQMLQVAGRPQWRVVQGGSHSYVRAMQARWRVRVRKNCPVTQVLRSAAGVQIVAGDGLENFDQVIFACHSDQALALLADPSVEEQQVLGAIGYQDNDVVLHTDARLLPRNPKAWAAWNAYVPAEPGAPCTVSYYMNALQGLQSRTPFIVTLNRTAAIDPGRILARMRYHHPVYTGRTVAAQGRRAEISGRRGSWYAGAYWGWGFHEDGVASALEVVRGINSLAPAISRVAA